MNTIEIIYIFGALVAILACVPQLKQLISAKASDELSLSTWSVWLICQCVTLAYVISIGSMAMSVVNIVWVGFYAIMCGLILHYRRVGRLAPERVEA